MKTEKPIGVLPQLKQANRARCKESFGHSVEDWSLNDWATAVAGETGELCDALKKVKRGDITLDEALENESLANEAADIVIYLDLLAQRAGFDLGTAIVNKFNSKSEEFGSKFKIYYY